MIQYEGAVFRPPSEAYSLIIQLTIGCARNTCTFCSMYKAKNFRVRKLEEEIQRYRLREQPDCSYSRFLRERFPALWARR